MFKIASDRSQNSKPQYLHVETACESTGWPWPLIAESSPQCSHLHETKPRCSRVATSVKVMMCCCSRNIQAGTSCESIPDNLTAWRMSSVHVARLFDVARGCPRCLRWQTPSTGTLDVKAGFDFGRGNPETANRAT